MSLYSIAVKYNGPLEAAHAFIDNDIDMMWLNDELRDSSTNLTSQISYEVVASLRHIQSVCAVQMSLYSIAAKYNGPLEAAHAYIDVDTYDVCG